MLIDGNLFLLITVTYGLGCVVVGYFMGKSERKKHKTTKNHIYTYKKDDWRAGR